MILYIVAAREAFNGQIIYDILLVRSANNISYVKKQMK